MPVESMAPLVPEIMLLAGVAAQIVYGLAYALALSLAPDRPRLLSFLRLLRILATTGGLLALAAAWLRADLVFCLGQTLLLFGYRLLPESGRIHG